jgi:hypothetical protein
LANVSRIILIYFVCKSNNVSTNNVGN